MAKLLVCIALMHAIALPEVYGKFVQIKNNPN